MGNNMDGADSDTVPTPNDVFSLVGNEIRLDIIRVLGDAQSQKDSKNKLSFSELRSRTNADLDPGQLNYHLQQLVGNFVKKTEDGYGIFVEGYRLYKTLRGGVFDRREPRVTIDAGFDCYFCQSTVEAMFSGGTAHIECPDCEYRYLSCNVPPAFRAFEDNAAAFEQISRYFHHKFIGYARGICPTCGNDVGLELVPPEEVANSGLERSKVFVYLSCNHCGERFFLRVGVALLTDHDLRSFCSDHGIDILSTPYWELEFAATDKHVSVRSTDPWKVALKITYNGDTLELVIDGDLNIVERNRLDGSCLEVILPDKTACLKFLRRQRWPDGIMCPHCNSADTTRKGTTGKDAQRYRCHHCRSIFNDLTGTMFADRHLSIPEMFHIIREMEEPEPAQLACQINRSTESVIDFMDNVKADLDDEAEFDLPGMSKDDEIYTAIGANGTS